MSRNRRNSFWKSRLCKKFCKKKISVKSRLWISRSDGCLHTETSFYSLFSHLFPLSRSREPRYAVWYAVCVRGFLLEVRRALETASIFPGRQKKAFPAKRFSNKRNPLLWICKIPFGRRLIDLISPFCADRKFHTPKGFFHICRKVNILPKS